MLLYKQMGKEWLKFLSKFYKSKKSVDGGYTYRQAMVDAAQEYKGGNAEKLSALAPGKVSGGKNDLAGDDSLYQEEKVNGGNAEKLSTLAPSKVSGGTSLAECFKLSPAEFKGGNAEKISPLSPAKLSGGKKSKKNSKSKKNKSKKNKSKRRN